MSFEGIATEQNYKKEFKKKHPNLHKFEKKIIDQYVDKYTNKAVQKLGYRRANWLPLVHVLVTFLVILNILVCFSRPDFLTTLVCVLAIFYLNDNDDINRDQFRFLPILLLISIAYDSLWLFYLQDDEQEGQISEGGILLTIIEFSLTISYVNFFFKVSAPSIILTFLFVIKVHRIFCALESVVQLLDRHQADPRRAEDHKASKDHSRILPRRRDQHEERK